MASSRHPFRNWTSHLSVVSGEIGIVRKAIVSHDTLHYKVCQDIRAITVNVFFWCSSAATRSDSSKDYSHLWMSAGPDQRIVSLLTLTRCATVRRLRSSDGRMRSHQ